VALLVLGLSGFSYAHWTDQLFVQGQINTGNICVDHYGVSQGDTGPDLMYIPQADNIVTVPGGKDIAQTTVGTSTIDGLAKVMTITINNAYPMYAVPLDTHAHNCGPVPITLYQVVFDAATNPKQNQTLTSVNGTAPYTVFIDLTGDGNPDIMVIWYGAFGTEIDYCISHAQDLSFTIVVLEPAPQGSQLTFQIELYFMNWNEYVPLPP